MPILPALLLCGILSAPATFEQSLEARFTASGTPGTVVAAFKDDKLVFSRAFGVADVASKAPMKPEMAFEIGSLSKQFTATVLLTLVRDGKLALSDHLGDILSDLPEAWRTATIEQTLHHMSGIPDYEEIAGYDFYNVAREPSEVINVAGTMPLDFPHGDNYKYSNTGYYLLSMVAEKRGGQPMSKLLDERIFRPLGMTETYTETAPATKTAATGYHSRSGTRAAQPPIAWSSTLGAGGIVSTIRDLGKWDAALYTEKILPASLRDKMWESATSSKGTTINYGFGWLMGTYRGVVRQNHSGQTNGFTCFYNRFPSLHFSVIAFTNTYDGDVFGLSGLVMPHFAPELSYLSMAIPEDPDASATERGRKALHQAAFGDEDTALLQPGMKDFATKPDFAKLRDEIKPFLATAKSFRFLRKTMRKSQSGADVEEFLYRLDYEGGQVFLTMRFTDGLLGSLNWELE
jgi:CubicO group peptidase (beta-lactamase class C family)